MRNMALRPSKEELHKVGVYTGIHLDRTNFTDEEWVVICKKRVELSQQDPDDLMCHEVFV